MISTPIGNFKTKEKNGEYPCIEIWLCDDDGKEIEMIAATEANPYDRHIATYAYCEGANDFANKTVYKKVK